MTWHGSDVAVKYERARAVTVLPAICRTTTGSGCMLERNAKYTYLVGYAAPARRVVSVR